jgi:hypothetical protein
MSIDALLITGDVSGNPEDTCPLQCQLNDILHQVKWTPVFRWALLTAIWPAIAYNRCWRSVT